MLCGTYHYTDPYKSFFRGLYTPTGKDVVASPPPDHPHHKGLQFGLTTSRANFWEEPGAAVPNNKLPFGQQQTTALKLEGTGFMTTYDDQPPYAGGPGFAFMGFIPIPRDLKKGDRLEASYIITVSDV
jgi:hypothetical protein